MSEAMTVETIVEAYWQFNGYWTKIRYPLKKKSGGWSDIDILSYNPESKILVISESKVRGPKRDVYAYTQHCEEPILEYLGGYLSFLDNVSLVFRDGNIFNDISKMIDKTIIQLVSNCYIENNIKNKCSLQIKKQVIKDIPQHIEIDVRLDTTLDIICELIEMEAMSPQGRRYGHPILDIVREINRYMLANIRGSNAGSKINSEIKEYFKLKLINALKLKTENRKLESL